MHNTEVQINADDLRDVYWQVINDTINEATWSVKTISPADADDMVLSNPSSTASLTTTRITSPTAGAVYELNCLIIVSSGQQFNKKATIIVN